MAVVRRSLENKGRSWCERERWQSIRHAQHHLDADCKQGQVRLQASTATQLEQERKRFESEKLNLNQKLKALAAKSRQGEMRAIELLKVQEDLRGKWQDELTYEKRELEGQVEKLKKQCLQLRMGSVISKAGGATTSTSLPMPQLGF